MVGWFSSIPDKGAALRACAHIVLASAATSACTQPTFPDHDASGPNLSSLSDGAAEARPFSDADAGSSPAAPDAEPPVAARRIPDDMLPLLGHYLRRSTFFDVADGQSREIGRGQELALLEFVKEGDGVVLVTEQCDLSVDNDLLVVVKLEDPSILALNPLRQPVMFDEAAHTFSIAHATVSHGYDPARADNTTCSEGGAGARLPSFADQVWMDGDTCVCPGAENQLPKSPTDCRVTDPDDDGQPGLTALASQTILPDFPWHQTLDVGLAYFDGRVKADRQLDARESRTLRSSCVDKLNGCASGNGSACRPETAETLFVPLDQPISCDDARRDRDKYFPTEVPAFPKLEVCTGG